MPCPTAPADEFTAHQLIVTLGPASFMLSAQLKRAGATAFRLNASHMTPEEVAGRCAALDAELPGVRCIVDLQGKKMRVGDIRQQALELGARVVLSADPSDTVSIFVPHPELFEQVSIGEHLSLDDGRIEIEIVGRAPNHLDAVVKTGGLLKPRKGLNRTEHPIELTDLTATDQAIIASCSMLGHVDYAVSFAEDGTEASWIHKRTNNRRVILKIERREALLNLPRLAAAADELWICRGDLGAQMGLIEMANAVGAFVPSALNVPILMAGQVLEHMRTNDAPTRSEACHLIDLMRRGYAGIVLSDETAIGAWPCEVTQVAAELMANARLAPR